MIGVPVASTAVIDGTIAETATAATSVRSASSARAADGPRRHASSASCSRRSAAGTRSAWGMRTRAATLPSASAAIALTAVLPTSMPIVTSMRDTGVTVRQHWHS
ncbi:hypothetical protein MINTMi198_44370 [Mycobacterium intracellulare M.i.198]|nr:hypothetical protein MINTMi198_44370 [Mycobacterium intracellulare M.i.198]